MWGRSKADNHPDFRADPYITEAVLHAYVDNLLPPRRRVEIEEYLAERPDEARRVSDFLAQNRGFHELFDRYLSDDLSPEIKVLEYHLAHRLNRRSRGRYATTAIAAVALLAVVGGGGYYGMQYLPKTNFNDEVFAALKATTSALRPAGGDVGSDDVVNASASAKIVEVPREESRPRGMALDLGEFGFQLVGTRLTSSEEGAETVQFTYESAEGYRIMLYVSPKPKSASRQVTLTQEGPITVLFWSDKGRSYSMIGEVERDTMLEIGQAVNGETGSDETKSSSNAKEAATARVPRLEIGDASEGGMRSESGEVKKASGTSH